MSGNGHYWASQSLRRAGYGAAAAGNVLALWIAHRGSDTSALLVWDSQSALIPIPRTPPTESRDPHGDPRKDVDVRIQKAAFLLEGEIVDVCGDAPCYADPN